MSDWPIFNCRHWRMGGSKKQVPNGLQFILLTEELLIGRPLAFNCGQSHAVHLKGRE